MRSYALFAAPLALVLTSAAQSEAPVGPPVIVTPVAPPALPAPPALRGPPPVIAIQSETPHLRGSSVYVYSFLDVRESELGDKVLAQFHRQLMEALRAQGVTAQLQLFRDSLHSQFFVPQAKVMNGKRVVDRVPVLETIAANSAQETAANSRYRLLILPADFTLSGAWRYYTVRWILMDTKTNQLLWKRDYKGSHLTIWKTNENAEGRGRKLTEAGMTMMHEDKLL